MSFLISKGDKFFDSSSIFVDSGMIFCYSIWISSIYAGISSNSSNSFGSSKSTNLTFFFPGEQFDPSYDNFIFVDIISPGVLTLFSSSSLILKLDPLNWTVSALYGEVSLFFNTYGLIRSISFVNYFVFTWRPSFNGSVI